MTADPDVVIVGGGPVGVMTAILLARRGFGVRVLEREPEVYDLPRAIVMDDEIQRVLQGAGLQRPAGGSRGTIRLLATDSAERFARVGGTFLGHPLQAAEVEVVDLQPAGPSDPGPASR